ENAFLVAFPGVRDLFGNLSNQLAGSVTVNMRNELWGAEANARLNMSGCSRYRADLLVGFRYLDVEDDLSIASVTRSTPASPNTLIPFNRQTIGAPFTLGVLDSFQTRNQYYGGQLGFHLETTRGRLFANLRTKVALGVMHQEADIAGLSRVTGVLITPTQ